MAPGYSILNLRAMAGEWVTPLHVSISRTDPFLGFVGLPAGGLKIRDTAECNSALRSRCKRRDAALPSCVLDTTRDNTELPGLQSHALAQRPWRALIWACRVSSRAWCWMILAVEALSTFSSRATTRSARWVSALALACRREISFCSGLRTVAAG